jgi:hypothetical protein
MPSSIRIPTIVFVRTRNPEYPLHNAFVVDEPAHYATEEQVRCSSVERFAEVLVLVVQEWDLYTDKFFDDRRRTCEEDRIREAKIVFLVGFWEELRGLGIVGETLEIDMLDIVGEEDKSMRCGRMSRGVSEQ